MLENTKHWLMRGDCLERMKEIPDGSVDMIACDLPYGTTACKWDVVIPFEPLWAEYRRVCKKNAAIVLTASQPFTSTLVMSNVKEFKHHWIWIKERGTGFQVAKYRPMMATEDVLAFCNGSSFNKYNPQMIPLDKPRKEKFAGSRSDSSPIANMRQGERIVTERYPLNTIYIARDKDKTHPTQKPVALFDYLIRTYTNENDIVLDNCMGSGTTGVACANSGRRFIGIERDETYFDLAAERIIDAYEKAEKLSVS